MDPRIDFTFEVPSITYQGNGNGLIDHEVQSPNSMTVSNL
jgi:hypothetical protein